MFIYVFSNLPAVQIMSYSMIKKKKSYVQICFHLNPRRTKTSNTLRKQGGKGTTLLPQSGNSKQSLT